MPLVQADDFRKLSIGLLTAAGARDAEASVLTESLVFASLHAHDTHGAGHLYTYVNAYLGLGPFGNTRQEDGEPIIVRETAATLAIDANWCLGFKVAWDATLKVIEKAKQTGIAAATMHRCSHVGALNFYTHEIVRNDMIGLAFAGAGAIAPPHGGTQRMLGTNPISIGVPAGEEYPFLADMSTAAGTAAEINRYLAIGGGLPEGLILDNDGEPTTDPTKFSMRAAGGEPQGAMQNMGGGHKGYALQLAVEMLGGIWSGLLSGQESFIGGRFNNPMSIIAVNVSFFQDLDAFKAKVDARIRELRASRKKAGVERILIPGERGFRAQETRLKEGLPIIPHEWERIVEQAEKLNVPLPDVESAAARG